MATQLQDNFLEDVAAGNVVVATDTFKMMLMTSSYTPNKAHLKRNSVTNEVTGTGYTAGGATCTVTIAKDTTNHRTSISISNTSWSTATITARYAMVYKSRGGASSADELVGLLDFGADIVSTGGTFQVSQTTPFYINH